MIPVLMLFLIPIGGGIPAGVILARDHDLAWPTTGMLYFVSDVILAFAFEPVLRLNAVIGDPNWTMAAILTAMIILPMLVRRMRTSFCRRPA